METLRDKLETLMETLRDKLETETWRNKMKTLGALFILICILIIYYNIHWYSIHPCIESHESLLHFEGHTDMIPVDKTFIPVYYPPYDISVTVCDKRKGDF